MNKIVQMIVLLSLFAFIPASFAELDLSLPSSELDLPDMGDPSQTVLSRTEEKKLGLQLVRELRRSMPLIEDAELITWLRSIGHRLLHHAPSSRNDFYFVILNDPTMNAFAMPGGVIAVNSGLVLNTDSESELAAVVGHEIAHVTQRHIARMQSETAGDGFKMGLAILAAMAASAYDPSIGQAAMMSAMAVQQHQLLGFSRQAEAEADRVGLRILAASEYDPQGMSTFLDKLDRHNLGEYEDLSKYLRSHPLTVERVSDVRSRARAYSGVSVREDVDYLYAKEKLRALLATGNSYRLPTIENPDVRRYAKAWLMAKGNRWQEAVAHLADVSDANALPILISKAKWLNEQQRYQETVTLLEPSLAVYPGHEAMSLLQAEALLALDNNREAWQLILAVAEQEQTSLTFFELKARAAEQVGEIGQSYQALVEKHKRLGDYKSAQVLLQQALKVPTLPLTDEARLRELLTEIEEEIMNDEYYRRG